MHASFLTEEQLQIRDMARDFAQNEIAPYAATWDKTGEFPTQVIQKMGELGLMGMLIDEASGGSQTGMVAYTLALAEISAADVSCSTIMGVHNSVVCMPLAKFGTQAQKEQFLQPCASGSLLGAFALTEPQAGSDAANVQTRAVKKGDSYILSGTKQFITSGKHADLTIVFAVTDPSLGKKGMTAFIVPTDSPGYEVARLEEKMGQHASDTAQLVFNDIALTEAYRLGAEGEGYKIALSNLEGGRIGIASQALGCAQAALNESMRYTAERQTFGKALVDHQAVAFRLADMATDIEAASLMVWQAASLRERGLPCLKEACMAKLVASEMAERVCSQALQVHGGYGYLSEFPLERYYRDIRVASIYEGTSDVQRMVIARELQKAI